MKFRRRRDRVFEASDWRFIESAVQTMKFQSDLENLKHNLEISRLREIWQ